MRAKRLQLDDKLRAIMKDICGSENVYYQPPANLVMKYPCIRYERSRLTDVAADDDAYLRRTRYSVTVIDSDPDSDIVAAVWDLRYCSHDRHYISDNLNHDVFTITV